MALFCFLTRTAFSSSPGTNLDDVPCETSSRYELEAPVPFLLSAVGIFSMLCCNSHKQQAGLALGKRVLSSEGKQRLSQGICVACNLSVTIKDVVCKRQAEMPSPLSYVVEYHMQAKQE